MVARQQPRIGELIDTVGVVSGRGHGGLLRLNLVRPVAGVSIALGTLGGERFRLSVERTPDGRGQVRGSHLGLPFSLDVGPWNGRRVAGAGAHLEQRMQFALEPGPEGSLSFRGEHGGAPLELGVRVLSGRVIEVSGELHGHEVALVARPAATSGGELGRVELLGRLHGEDVAVDTTVSAGAVRIRGARNGAALEVTMEPADPDYSFCESSFEQAIASAWSFPRDPRPDEDGALALALWTMLVSERPRPRECPPRERPGPARSQP